MEFFVILGVTTKAFKVFQFIKMNQGLLLVLLFKCIVDRIYIKYISFVCSLHLYINNKSSCMVGAGWIIIYFFNSICLINFKYIFEILSIIILDSAYICKLL